MIALLGLAGAASSAGFGTAPVSDPVLAGRPVPAGQVQLIAVASLSCPALTPAKLAAQLMVASGFEIAPTSGSGSSGLAGLSDAAWDRWKPYPGAERTEPAAQIQALAHYTCDLIGQVRLAGIAGDQWQLALAAHHSGVATVNAARGVPESARRYVSTVVAYAAWYATLEGTGTAGPGMARVTADPSSSGDRPPLPVPDGYLAAVVSAGSICPLVSPVRVAAQLMASSGFNPNLMGADGAEGIAQFTPNVWAKYAQAGAVTGPWDPSAAIPVLGRAMCGLLSELSGLGRDPYAAALAAFRSDVETVKHAGGVPDSASLSQYVALVQQYVNYYARDSRLMIHGKSPTPAPSARPVTQTAKPQTSTSPAAPPSPTLNWQTLTVEATQVLSLGQAWSTNRLSLMLGLDGDIVLYDQGNVVWRAHTAGKGGCCLVFQSDGHLVLYDGGSVGVWGTQTAGNAGAVLVLHSDGNVSISLHGQTLWETGTGR
ncbi:hypothetical protein [Dactylosporangium darangshiense]|uniref:hypothetical protein n=1 Tax=Dactylosporangium darangshiense TaxID=579108 RepID=UPI0031E96F52